MKRNITVGGVVIGHDGKIVVVDQGNSVTLPKGRNEEGESLVQTAHREIKEETGITDLQLVKKLGSYKRFQMADKDPDSTEEYKEDKNVEKTIHIYLFKTTQKELSPEAEDIVEAKWVSKGEVYGLLTHPKDKEFFEGVVGEI
jgi:ADP-ribose pyrophosphatase YjhB (NUDIX family)